MNINKNNLIVIVAAMALLTVAAFKVTNAESTEAASNKEEKSVAWYVTNTKEAREQNQLCHDNVNIQSTPNCTNALHALQISFAGGNGRR
jgi:invasion protein IalB